MDTPNPDLMHIYGTDAYYLEKVGAFKDVLRMAAPVAWMGLVAHRQEEEERLRREAEAMNMAMREAEAERMRPTLQGFFGHDAPRQPMAEDLSDPETSIRSAMLGLNKISMPENLTKFAEGIGRSLAHREMAKVAIGQHLQDVQAPPMPNLPTPHPPGGPYRVQASVPPASTPRAPSAPMPKPGPSPWAVGPPPAPPPVPKPSMPKKPLISRGTIGKGVGALALAGLAYGGYKLINKAKQKMDQPHYGGHAWGQEQPAMYSGVGEYAHPVY